MVTGAVMEVGMGTEAVTEAVMEADMDTEVDTAVVMVSFSFVLKT